MIEKADRTAEAFRRLRELHLHRTGPRIALRAAARYVLTGTVIERREELATEFELDGAGLGMQNDLLVRQALRALRHPGDNSPATKPDGIIVVLPCAANDNGHAFPSLASCKNS